MEIGSVKQNLSQMVVMRNYNYDRACLEKEPKIVGVPRRMGKYLNGIKMRSRIERDTYTTRDELYDVANNKRVMASGILAALVFTTGYIICRKGA